MAKFPAPAATGDDCICINGVKVCPHIVHLTDKQMKRVKTMHESNVARAKKAAAKAKKAAKKKKTKKKS